MACNSKTADHRVKQNLELGHSCNIYMGYLDLLRSFSAFVLKWPVTQKWLAIELKGVVGSSVVICICGTIDF